MVSFETDEEITIRLTDSFQDWIERILGLKYGVG